MSNSVKAPFGLGVHLIVLKKQKKRMCSCVSHTSACTERFSTSRINSLGSLAEENKKLL